MDHQLMGTVTVAAGNRRRYNVSESDKIPGMNPTFEFHISATKQLVFCFRAAISPYIRLIIAHMTQLRFQRISTISIQCDYVIFVNVPVFQHMSLICPSHGDSQICTNNLRHRCWATISVNIVIIKLPESPQLLTQLSI